MGYLAIRPAGLPDRVQVDALRRTIYAADDGQGSIVYPGNFGTFNWGAVAVDPERQVVFAMPVYLAFTSKLIPRPNADKRVVTEPG